MSKHTPGPWQHVGFSGTSGAHVVASTGGDWVANCGGPPEAEEVVANANLIAAAPLLKETNYAMAMFGLQSERYKTDIEFRIAVDEALNAHRLAGGL